MEKNQARVDQPPGPAPASAPDAPAKRSGRFAIVGIGGSAGGLEAYEEFFQQLPADSGLAFVLVAHLDPDHASLLTEILQRSTAMPVREAVDQVTVTPNTVYIIPPNHDMAIAQGRLCLSAPALPHGRRMPIDAFLRTLADDQGDQAIGIVLSGTGSDGTLGLRAIHGAGGITLVQEPASAKFAGMPSSAIASGYAMHVLQVGDMATVLLAAEKPLAESSESPAASEAGEAGEAGEAAIDAVLQLLHAATGHDFSNYKKGTVGRRIARRMMQRQLHDIDDYRTFLGENPDEAQALFKDLLINVTAFFRDPEAFEVLQREILPALLAGKAADYALRIWVAGCASGEEAY